jgi:hypothetical protein
METVVSELKTVYGPNVSTSHKTIHTPQTQYLNPEFASVSFQIRVRQSKIFGFQSVKPLCVLVRPTLLSCIYSKGYLIMDLRET